MTLKKRISALGICCFMLSGIMFCSLTNGGPIKSKVDAYTGNYVFGESGFDEMATGSEAAIQALKRKIDENDPNYNRTKAVQSKQKLIDIATEVEKYTHSNIASLPGASAYDSRMTYFETYAEIISHYGSSSSTTSSSSSSQSSSNSTTSQATTTNTNTNAGTSTNASANTTTATNQNVITLDLHGGSMKGDSVIAGVNTTYEVLVSDIQYVTLASYTQDLVPPEGYHFMSWAVENGNPVSEFSASLAGKTIYAVWADDVTSVIMGGYPWSLN